MPPSTVALPEHGQLSHTARFIELTSLVGAIGLLLWHFFRLAQIPELFTWWLPIAVLAAMALSDFASGIVHWVADTWGSESIPVLGRRFLRPFRVHHINPDDFLQRDFIDTNGDVAMIAIPVLLGVFAIPLDTGLGQLSAVFLVAFAACALPTNQVHQWAHMSEPPKWVRWLQKGGLLLSREQHQLHHNAPHATNYCITNGWCNRALSAVNFFPALEWIISRLTGLTPRGEDRVYASSFQTPAVNAMANDAAEMRS